MFEVAEQGCVLKWLSNYLSYKICLIIGNVLSVQNSHFTVHTNYKYTLYQFIVCLKNWTYFGKDVYSLSSKCMCVYKFMAIKLQLWKCAFYFYRHQLLFLSFLNDSSHVIGGTSYSCSSFDYFCLLLSIYLFI